MFARESDDRLDIRVRVCRVWNMSSARERKDLHRRKRLCELANYRSEGRWTLVTEREESWPEESSNPVEVEAKLLWIVRLVEECRCVLDVRLLNVGRQLGPRAGSERHGLDELLGGTGMIPGRDALDHGTDPLIYFFEQRR